MCIRDRYINACCTCCSEWYSETKCSSRIPGTFRKHVSIGKPGLMQKSQTEQPPVSFLLLRRCQSTFMAHTSKLEYVQAMPGNVAIPVLCNCRSTLFSLEIYLISHICICLYHFQRPWTQFATLSIQGMYLSFQLFRFWNTFNFYQPTYTRG